MDRLKELGDFLRAKRAHLPVPDGVLFGGTHRRVPGLRREEVSQLALISTAYYTKLERGRVPGISAAVLDGLTAALQLSPEERAYVTRLIPVAGEQVPHRAGPAAGDAVSPVLQRVLDSLGHAPAHVQNERCDLVATNDLGKALYPYHFEAPRPNTVRFLFLDPRARTFFLEWEMWADQGVYFLRSAYARNPGDQQLQRMIQELRTASPDFLEAWETHEVEFAPLGTRRLRHPDVGQLDLDFQNLHVAGQEGLRVTVYTAEPGSLTAGRLEKLTTIRGG